MGWLIHCICSINSVNLARHLIRIIVYSSLVDAMNDIHYYELQLNGNAA